jgi:hypothetical protein
LINRAKKSTEPTTPKAPKAPKKTKAPKKRSGRSLDDHDTKIVEIIGEGMEPIFKNLEETKLMRGEIVKMGSEVARVATALEEIVGLLRDKWSGEPMKDSGVGAEIEKEDKFEGRTQASGSEESGSSSESDESVDEVMGKADGDQVDDEDDEDDEDVTMAEDGPAPLTSGPIGIVGDPIAGPSSSSAA